MLEKVDMLKKNGDYNLNRDDYMFHMQFLTRVIF